MKELSIEEKARLYDEAIKRAREFVCKDNVEVAEYIFPELSGSEDEKIRKEILSFLRTGNPYSCPNSKRRNRWADWLEKQGEPNPTDKGESNLLTVERAKEISPFMRSDFENESADKVEPKFKVGDKIVEKEPDECGCGVIIDIKDGKYIFNDGGFICIEEQGLWKLVEQNPAWSEEDKKTLERVIRCIENHDYMNVDDIHWLKSLKDRCTWKPSDEQMNALDSTLQYSQVSHNSFEYLNSLFNDLKKLKG